MNDTAKFPHPSEIPVSQDIPRSDWHYFAPGTTNRLLNNTLEKGELFGVCYLDSTENPGAIFVIISMKALAFAGLLLAEVQNNDESAARDYPDGMGHNSFDIVQPVIDFLTKEGIRSMTTETEIFDGGETLLATIIIAAGDYKYLVPFLQQVDAHIEEL